MTRSKLWRPRCLGVGLLLSLLFVPACRTPYGPYECRGIFETHCVGYSEIELAPNTYQVRFEVPANTTGARLSAYTLLRSAELPLESGFDHFVIHNITDETTTGTQAVPGTYAAGMTTCAGSVEDGLCVTSPGTWIGGGVYTTLLPGFSYTIYLVDSAEVQSLSDDGETIVYDARSVQRDLRRKYDLPHGESVPPAGTRD